MRIIKKYPNRRLYDTDESRYITLDELATCIRGGVDVRVVDTTTGHDLTAATLTQIILESRSGAQLLPVPLLMQLVRMKEEALAEFFGRYVGFSLELYLSAKRGAEGLIPLNPLATVPFAASNALAKVLLSGLSLVSPNERTAGRRGGRGTTSDRAEAARALAVPIDADEPLPPSDPAPSVEPGSSGPTGLRVAPDDRASASAEDLADLRAELAAIKAQLQTRVEKPPRKR